MKEPKTFSDYLLQVDHSLKRGVLAANTQADFNDACISAFTDLLEQNHQLKQRVEELEKKMEFVMKETRAVQENDDGSITHLTRSDLYKTP